MKQFLTKYNHKIKAYLKRLSWWERLWLLMPVVIWFSYQPRISLGGNQTMNFELSLPLIYVTMMALMGLPLIWRQRRDLWHNKYTWAVTGFVLWSGLSVIWSPNLTRAVLTFGITGVLYLIFLAIIADRDKFRLLIPFLCRILLISSLVICALALAQMVAGVWLQNGDDLWLCRGCVASNFGFVRPNLFAIEPQFLGNLLLAPALLSLWQFVNGRKKPFSGICLATIVMAIVLTLSRGAIYALAVGGLVMLSISIGKVKLRRQLGSIGLMMGGGIIALLVQGALAAINPNLNVSFGETITKSVNQLTLGVIDLSQIANKKSTNEQTHASPTPAPLTNNDKNTTYDGYVAESTDVRVNLSKVALSAWWRGNIANKIFGFGLGSSGIVMAKSTGSNYEKEIVQNEFVEVLLERGLVGLILLIMLIGGFIWHARQQKWIWGILAAYLIQYCFFSGLPNALHVYLILMVAYAFVLNDAEGTKRKSAPKSKRRVLRA